MEVYEKLGKFDVKLTEDEQMKKDSLDEAFNEFTTMLSNAEKMLERCKGLHIVHEKNIFILFKIVYSIAVSMIRNNET
jgi:hypothetical protein